MSSCRATNAKLLDALRSILHVAGYYSSERKIAKEAMERDKKSSDACPVVQSRSSTLMLCACGKLSLGTFEHPAGHTLPICDACRDKKPEGDNDGQS